MQTNRAEFLSRFLYRLRDDEWYGNPGLPAASDVLGQASATAKDTLGFDVHRDYFTALAEIIDICVSEELAARGSGIEARNATKHPRVVALSKSDPQQRAGVAAAAAQGLAWMEECRQWVQDATLRNQIAKRVMMAILVAAGRIKKGYSSAQLAALASIGASMKDNDLFVLRARGAIAEILAGNVVNLPRDENTIAALRRLLDSVAERPNAAPALKAVEKLMPLTENGRVTQ